MSIKIANILPNVTTVKSDSYSKDVSPFAEKKNKIKIVCRQVLEILEDTLIWRP